MRIVPGDTFVIDGGNAQVYTVTAESELLPLTGTVDIQFEPALTEPLSTSTITFTFSGERVGGDPSPTTATLMF